ncbi:aspartic protease-like protein [Corchorus olitorius]|uniref:Aspartic protease-like protein n=1 Tax=Corchorus olitorius TaxID=93759 RepID=A0A1R3KP25_9ROSI|nr:aspartic protease-like protein [Corchorus olitorius]
MPKKMMRGLLCEFVGEWSVRRKMSIFSCESPRVFSERIREFGVGYGDGGCLEGEVLCIEMRLEKKENDPLEQGELTFGYFSQVELSLSLLT